MSVAGATRTIYLTPSECLARKLPHPQLTDFRPSYGEIMYAFWREATKRYHKAATKKERNKIARDADNVILMELANGKARASCKVDHLKKRFQSGTANNVSGRFGGTGQQRPTHSWRSS